MTCVSNRRMEGWGLQFIVILLFPRIFVTDHSSSQKPVEGHLKFRLKRRSVRDDENPCEQGLHMIDGSGWLKDAKPVLRGQDVKMGAIGA
jgi:hypothetical protein